MLSILEGKTGKQLIKLSEQKNLVIAAGNAGIPVT
jgi:carbamate kinase